jgi:putative endonuclease
MKLYYVYIVLCADGSYYVGITNNVENRVAQHNESNDSEAYTYSRRPVKLAYTEMFTEVLQAIAREKQIKRWSRVKKQALINENWDSLNKLAECKNETSHKSFKSNDEKGCADN